MNRRDNYLVRRLDGFIVLAAVLLVTWWRGETPGRLVWGYWICGLVLPPAVLAAAAAGRLRRGGLTPRTLLGGLLGLAVLAWTLVFVNRIYGEILDLAFPLWPDPARVYVGNLTWKNVRPFLFWPAVGQALQEYYWLALCSLWSVRVVLRDLAGGIERPLQPSLHLDLYNVRLHLIVLALVAAQIVEQVVFAGRPPAVEGFAYAALVQTVAYFPWQQSPRPAARRI